MSIDQQHYNTGWNDTEHGVNHWTDSDHWANPVQWAVHIKRIAEECKPKAVGSHNKAYYQGVIDCATAYQNTGKVDRK